jgi:carbon storage regulator
MLVIRRRAGELLVIGGNIEVEILETAGSHVKIGIRAPREITVMRKEICLAGQQNREASRPFQDSAVNQLRERLAPKTGQPLKLTPR